jgi:hypothetical protein
MSTMSIAPVAAVLASNATPAFDGESVSAMIPEPTTAARRKAVPRNSAVSFRAVLKLSIRLSSFFILGMRKLF